ncbi:PucR family transcriptional regulator [Allobacillus halotolerans]|uniref:PucR family transcriptional regulator ligand-binding domain-containing protein n=1 Tax=Allobacillus halotolerans TaxID=570278 RepID=A0ABS6GNA0_9BACI|nr:PucR family transcriptional regulator [Allobacillus halotolerans]MBU6080563.1 PucR family transcriptional regulator ligand-binding domain-containing protein [Allobacillus halotolerans]
MGLRLSELMNIPSLQDVHVVTGESLLETKKVEWVSIVELPVQNFIRKHELVLSSATNFRQDSDLSDQFVSDIIQSGATALAVASDNWTETLPQRIIDMANENQFILLLLNWKSSFSDIVQESLQVINEHNEKRREKTEALRIKLMDQVLNNSSLEALIKILYKEINIPVAISDEEKQIRANYDFDQEIIDAINQFNDLPVQLMESPIVPSSDHPLYQHINQYTVGNQTCYELTIFSNHKKQGYLLFMPKSPDELDWFVMHALEHGLTACALYFLTENAIEMTEIRLKDNFVMQLAKEIERMDAKILSKGDLLGYDLSLRYACIVGDFTTGFSETSWREEKDQPGHSSLHSLNYYIQKEITYAEQQLNRRTMSSFEEGEVVIFLEIDEGGHQKTVSHFLDMIERRLHDQLAGITFAWGIGIHNQGLQSFYKSYQEARTALDLHVEQTTFGGRTFFEETKLNRLLLSIEGTDALINIVNDTIRPLLEYDRKKQSDLIHTFMTYQTFKGNVSQTARALFLHRQTLLYRLRRIESLTGLTLVDSDDSFLLEMSIRLWQLKNGEWNEA